MAWKMNPIYFQPYITKCRIRTKQVYKFDFALYILYYILTSVWRRHFVSAVYVSFFFNVTLLYHRVWLTFCRRRFKLADISQYFVFDAWVKKSPNYKLMLLAWPVYTFLSKTWIISHKIIVLFHLTSHKVSKIVCGRKVKNRIKSGH